MFSNDIVLNILNYIDNNLYKKITIDELSNIFNYNKDYLMRLFKKEMKCTIIDYINKLRIYNSLDTLKNTRNTILNIALSFGFSSQEYYSEMFNKIMGVSPSRYRKFFNKSYLLSVKDIELIRENIVLLNNYIDYINYYKRNTYTVTKVKVLSIFK